MAWLSWLVKHRAFILVGKLKYRSYRWDKHHWNIFTLNKRFQKRESRLKIVLFLASDSFHILDRLLMWRETATICIRDLSYLDLKAWFQARANFHRYPKNIASFKSGQKWPQKNHLNSFTNVQCKSVIYTLLYENHQYVPEVVDFQYAISKMIVGKFQNVFFC